MSSTNSNGSTKKTDSASTPIAQKTDRDDVCFIGPSTAPENRPGWGAAQDFLRALDGDPRIVGGVLDVARVMAAWADADGRCNSTLKQIQERLVSRREDGSYVPERTVKSWREKLKTLGVARPVDHSAGLGFAGPGRGNGTTWELEENRWSWGAVEDVEDVRSKVKAESRASKADGNALPSMAAVCIERTAESLEPAEPEQAWCLCGDVLAEACGCEVRS